MENNGNRDNESEWVGFEKRLKGLRRRQNRIKPEKLTWQQNFHVSQCRSKVIAKSRKDKEPEIMRREVRRRTTTAEDLQLTRGSNPLGDIEETVEVHVVWIQDRKGQVGTHLCERNQPCETDAP